MRPILLVAATIAVLLLAGCGDGSGSEAPPRSATTAPPAGATASPEARPTPSRFSAEDPAGDCQSNQNQPIACEPAALDERRFTIERDAAGNVIATIEIGGAGFPALGAYTALIGIDTDRNAATGNTGYAAFHGLAPDVELVYAVRTAGQPAQPQVRMFPGPQPVPGDASLVEWKLVDNTHLQATIKPALIGGPTSSFFIVTDLQLADRYDHIPDNAKVSFPEGRVIPK